MGRGPQNPFPSSGTATFQLAPLTFFGFGDPKRKGRRITRLASIFLGAGDPPARQRATWANLAKPVAVIFSPFYCFLRLLWAKNCVANSSFSFLFEGKEVSLHSLAPAGGAALSVVPFDLKREKK